MKQQLEQYFGKDLFHLLEMLAGCASQCSARLFLVGGLTRDLMLLDLSPDPITSLLVDENYKAESIDIDIMVQGQLESFLEIVQTSPSLFTVGRTAKYPDFGTAKLEFLGVVQGAAIGIDFAEARKERYPIAGAKPEVSAGTLQEDQLRRDFSVNALAIELEDAFTLLDPGGAVDDLELRQLRVFHEHSFQDDPARLFRALRFIARLNFKLEEETAKLARDAVEQGRISTLTPGRRYSELRKNLSEKEPVRQLELLAQWGLLEQVDSRLSFARERYDACLARAEGEVPNLSLIAIASLIADKEEAESICKHFSLAKADRSTVVQLCRETSGSC